MQEQLIKLFYEYLPAWSWDEWQAAGSSDREEIVINAIADLGPEVDIDEAYDIFYDWAAGLTEADFNTRLTEAAQKKYKITYREDGVSKSFTVLASSKAEAEQKAWSQVDADSVWVTELEEELTEYFEGSLSDFDGDPNEILKSFADEPSYSGYAADLAGISNRSGPGPDAARTKEDIKLRNKCLAAAQKAIESGDAAVEIYNRGRWSRYFDRAFVPAIDPETLELVYDKNKKSDISVRAFAAMHQRQSEYNANYAAKRKAAQAAATNENIEEMN
jgi:hypothetical protein